MAAASSSLGTQFQEELTCSICLELFTRPKVLPCQHTFCQDCLQDLAGRGGTFQCPNCRQQVRLPPQGVTGLPDNLMAANMCEILQQQTLLSGPAARGTGHHHGNHREREQHSQRVTFGGKRSGTGQFGRHSAPAPAPAPIPAELASTTNVARGRGHHHGNQWQGEPQSQYQRTTFGTQGFGFGQFMRPVGVTVTEKGEIFVADRDNQRIQVFTLQGTFVRQFPTVVSGEKKMRPHDVAMDGEGNLWVVGWSVSSDLAMKYNKQGRVLGKFDLQKTNWYRGVAVDTRRNHILITQFTRGDCWDNRHGEVLVFRPNGTLEITVGQQQGMKIPQYITMDGEGNFLVSDYENHCVYVYNKDKQFLFQFGGEGSGEGQLKGPLGICTDRAGNIIVADLGNRRVEMFDKTGRFLKHIATDMERPYAVAMAPEGQLVVTDFTDNKVTIFPTFCLSQCLENLESGGTLKCAVCRQQVRLPPQGVTGLPDNLMAANMCEILQQQTSLPAARGTGHHHGNHRQQEHQSQRLRFGGKRSGTGQFDRHSAPAPAPAPIPAALASTTNAARGRGHRHGNQWQGEPQSQYHRTTIGTSGSGPGQFYSPSGVTVSEEGEIFVADRDNQRIQVFTLQGTFVRQFPTVVPRREEKIKPEDVALDGKGNLWVVGRTEFAQFAVQYNKQGRVLRKFDLQESEWYRGVAVDTRRNHILIIQTTGHWVNLHGEVLVYRPDGTLVRTVGQQQGMRFPRYITVGREGNILVSDSDNHFVYVYNEDGQFLFSFGGEGRGEGQLKGPGGICTDRAGNIIVVDLRNRRVEMFDKTGNFGKHITTDVRMPCAVAMAPQGQFVVTDVEKNTVSIFPTY
ncbi:uncharacterized protein LOC118405135 [Branchiostoma floridae]|uniref:RING-type E3 ubiquitin transferase n=1 Tax=Branchiostoma floridae TaxID=7739 RepID=A0A9J7HIT2_BRAFL|nr:uncharacterized protein LOC118405135 [Branchiostoma floridae]